jgi:hypothetical protein
MGVLVILIRPFHIDVLIEERETIKKFGLLLLFFLPVSLIIQHLHYYNQVSSIPYHYSFVLKRRFEFVFRLLF